MRGAVVVGHDATKSLVQWPCVQMPLSSIFKLCNLALPPRRTYRGLNLDLGMSTTDWLELAESRRQSAYERSRPPLRMPVSCRKESLDVFFSHGKISQASRVLEHMSTRIVSRHLLPPVRQNHLSNIKCDYPGSVFRKPASGPGASRQKADRKSVNKRNNDGGI